MEIDHIFYINLDRRPDRRANIESNLTQWGLMHKSERFPAIATTPGCIGCSMSHAACIELSITRGYKNVLILEDDVVADTINLHLDKIPEKWDVILFDYNLKSEQAYENPNFGRVEKAGLTSAYLVNEHYMKILRDNIIEGIPKLQSTGMHWHYAVDVYWNSLQKRDMWLYLKNHCMKQGAFSGDT